MGWTGVITNVGNAALERVIASGSQLNINEVKIGMGYTNPANARQRISLVEEVGRGSIERKRIVNGGMELSIFIPPQDMEYLIKEVGVFATINGQSVMVALYQDRDGLSIPSRAAFPDYAFNLVAVWDIDSTGELTVTIDPSALVTRHAMEEALSDYVTVDQGPENAGKILAVGQDGRITLKEIGLATGVGF